VSEEAAPRAPHEQRDRLLSIVALLAAWSGYAATKWATESRLELNAGSSARNKASRAILEAMEVRNFDSSAFEAWFAAYTARNEEAMALAERRFRPRFREAFAGGRRRRPARATSAPAGMTVEPPTVRSARRQRAAAPSKPGGS
jgi:hypothetical protein